MAARINKRQTAQCRQAIKITQIINRLQNHIEGKVDMVPSQVTAAKVLLAKALPDLSVTEMDVYQREERTPEEMRARLIELLGSANVDPMH